MALEKKEYYGFPGNHFWPLLYEIFAAKSLPRQLMTYKEKIHLLKTNRVALWDVVKSCKRRGASDHWIKEERPNNILRLVRKQPSLRVIFLNGRTASKLFRKYFGETIRMTTYDLPSTSPAYASMTYRDKLKKWRFIKKCVGNHG